MDVPDLFKFIGENDNFPALPLSLFLKSQKLMIFLN